jgi:hypothetical protein
MYILWNPGSVWAIVGLPATRRNAMLSALQQKQVWEGWLSSEIRANYFADLSGRYHRIQRLVTWAILFFSSGAAVAFVPGLLPAYPWVPPALSILVAALSAYALAVQNRQTAIECADLHFRWNALASEYECLWGDMYADDAPERLRLLDARGMELSKAATALPVIEKRLLKWQDYVERHHAPAVRASWA